MHKEDPYSNCTPGETNKSIEVINHNWLVPDNKKTIVMIDPRTIVRESLLELLQQQSNDLSFLSFSTINEAIEQTRNIHAKNSLFLLNVGGSDLSLEGIKSQVNCLTESFSEIPIVILADNEELLSVKLFSCLELSGFMTMNISPEELTAILKLVLVGGRYIPECLIRKLQQEKEETSDKQIQFKNTQAFGDKNFTPRQLDVLEMLYHGLPNKVIAYQLHICESTVKVHVREIMKKLCATNRTQVAYLVSKLFEDESSARA